MPLTSEDIISLMAASIYGGFVTNEHIIRDCDKEAARKEAICQAFKINIGVIDLMKEAKAKGK